MVAILVGHFLRWKGFQCAHGLGSDWDAIKDKHERHKLECVSLFNEGYIRDIQ